MKGKSSVVITGDVGEVIVGSTKKTNTPAVSITVAIDDGAEDTVWARVNMYGSLAALSATKLGKGSRVTVYGSLVNRKTPTGETLLEIKALDIIFI